MEDSPLQSRRVGPTPAPTPAPTPHCTTRLARHLRRGRRLPGGLAGASVSGLPAALLAALLAAPLATLGLAARAAVPGPDLESPAARAAVGNLGPWPPAVHADPTNRIGGDARAIELGRSLFESPRLSSVGALRCATCHEPWRGFVDGRHRGHGAADSDRKTLTLYNAVAHRWYGWDGANDTLWGQSIRPLTDPREMGSSAAVVGAALRDDVEFRQRYASIYGRPPGTDDAALLVDAGKLLAAYVATLISPRTPFDEYRDAVVAGNRSGMARYPAPARRGLELFLGKAQCVACHSGALFSDDRFHVSLVRSRLADGTPDAGRQLGVARYLASPYRADASFSDARSRRAPDRAALAPAGTTGAFRTPSLREAALAPPYMHDGSVANLCDTLAPHALQDRATDSEPATAVALSQNERRDLVAFLRSLASPTGNPLVSEDVYDCR